MTSSCEDQDGGKVTSSSTTSRRLTTIKPKLLDSFLQTTQQPQVSTSDDVIEIEDETDEDLCTSDIIKAPQDKDDGGVAVVIDHNVDVEPVQQSSSPAVMQNENEVIAVASEEDMSTSLSKDVINLCQEDSPYKLCYDADSEDEEAGATPTKGVTRKDGDSKTSGSSEAESSTGQSSSVAGLSTPRAGAAKLVKVRYIYL